MLFPIISWEPPQVSKSELQRDGTKKAQEGLEEGKQETL